MLTDQERDEFYAYCAQAINQAGRESESLLLARAILLMAEEVGDIQKCKAAVAAALKGFAKPGSTS